MCKKIYRIFAILFIFLSSACSGIESHNTQESDLEILHGISVFGDNLLLQVSTNGCTQKEHFKINLDDNDEQYELTVMRSKPDLCRRKTSLMELQFSLKALTIDKTKNIIITNPIRAFNGVRFK